MPRRSLACLTPWTRALAGVWGIAYALVLVALPVAEASAAGRGPAAMHVEARETPGCPAAHHADDCGTCAVTGQAARVGGAPVAPAIAVRLASSVRGATGAQPRPTEPRLAGLGSRAPPTA